MADKIFVYGTLMKDFRNYNKYLKNHVLKIEKGYVKGKLYHMPYLDFPALIDGDEIIQGEVLTIDDIKTILPLVDEMEGYKGCEDDMYKRIPQIVTLEDGSTIELDVYKYYAVENDERFATEAIYLPNGNWREYKENL